MGEGPLAGCRVVVTRAREQADSLVDALRTAGAEPIVVPSISFVAPADGGAALRAGLAKLTTYDWLLLTSVNAIERVEAELQHDDLAAVDRTGVATAVIGAKTAEAARSAGFRVELVPDDFVGEGLLAVMPKGEGTMLFPRAAIGRITLLDGLADLGWRVNLVETYQTLPATIDEAARRRAAAADVVTFTSPSTFAGYMDGLDGVLPIVASIGPVTTAAIQATGVEVAVEATPHTIDGLVASLASFWSARGD